MGSAILRLVVLGIVRKASEREPMVQHSFMVSAVLPELLMSPSAGFFNDVL